VSSNSPGNREVAHRLFAAEFNDATYSYSESDEERAPNYVVTPTGARVNRLFAIGVLPEVTRAAGVRRRHREGPHVPARGLRRGLHERPPREHQ